VHCQLCRKYSWNDLYAPVFPVHEVEVAMALADKKKEYELCSSCWLQHHREFAAEDLADAMLDLIIDHRKENEQKAGEFEDIEDKLVETAKELEEARSELALKEAEIQRLEEKLEDRRLYLEELEDRLDIVE